MIDLRSFGLAAAVELEPRPGAPGARAFDAFLKAYDKGVIVRAVGDNVVIAPALIVEADQIERIADTIREVLGSID